MPKKAKKSLKKKSSKTEDSILKEILANEKKILGKEEEQLREEKKVEFEEEEQLAELKDLEKDLKKDIKQSALGKITFRDFTKSLIGALFGILGHFAYHLGPEIAEHISMPRASLLYLASFLVAVMFVYFAGFRKVDKKYIMWLPVRVIVIYVTSLAVIVAVLFLFGDLHFGVHWEEAFKTVSAISLLAVLGASAADLIGKEE